MKLSDLRLPVISALRWTAMSRLLMQVITWSATIITLRLLSPTDYGIVTVATLLSNYLTMLSEAGFGSAIVQRQVRDRPTLSAIFSVLLIVGSLSAVVIYSLAPLIGSVFREPRAIPVMRLAALQFVLLPFATVPDAMLQMEFRFKEFGMANVAGAVTSATSVVGLALAGAGPFALVGGMLLSQAVRVYVMQRAAKTPIAFTTNLGPTRSLLRYSTLVVMGRSAWYWYTEADSAVVARLLGTNALGTFSVAKNTMQSPLDRIAEVVNAVGFSAYSRMRQGGGSLSEAFLKSLRVGSYLVFPLFWGLGAVAEPLVKVAFGQKWIGAILPMQILSIAMPLRALQSMSTPVIHAAGRPDISLTLTLSAVVVIIPLLIIGVANFGVAGAAGGWAVGYPLVYFFSICLYTRPLSLRPSQVWLVVATPVLCGVPMVILVLFTVYGLLSNARPWLQLVAGITVGVSSYVTSVALLDRKAFRELAGLMLSFAKR